MEIIKAYRYVFTLRKISSLLNLDVLHLFKDKMLNLSYLVLRFILGKFISKIKDINKLIKSVKNIQTPNSCYLTTF